MNTKTLWAMGLLTIIVALGVYGYSSYRPGSELPPKAQVPSDTVSNGDQSAIEAVIVEYGATLQKPSKINIVSIAPRASGKAFESYQVEANIVETVSGSPSGVYPVSITVEKQGGSWMITALTKGAYSELPQRTTITGIWECLPHKGDGPHTMECAFGIAKDQSDGHYAVDTSLMSTYPVDYPTGTHLKIEGIVTPANQLSSVQKYDIDGIIRATSITKI
ncbi:hypothetical protein A2419_02560 [Candidatus Adlerbacteria bacterium RIFOXYC1_FULL_48_26]|uniref:Uncharacterized protein n=1 Tax=Candidatus Adlerbacteria bacterium RIFOXYC1_FULL_48_26 TaxID=1797247 RepID=A0A1F4Y4H3_9BACT|nr:MAG: hypothetical protein A2419_02560 [Candidatus Adlerbacteria bacterium RIFOXYC1_FULL_48_26]OGC93739.1 MAG: hypothetical protein A2389_01010 [Candidatus Adlerbacteria bacterium RIFOXYB1_FULL_48_10]